MSTSAATTVVNAANKATSFANQTVETARFDVIKEPLGFIKIVQFFMALLAFSIAVNGTSDLYFTVNCNAVTTSAPNTTVSATGFLVYKAIFSYPYDLKDSKFEAQNSCPSPRQLDRYTVTDEGNNIQSSAQFFVFVGVMAFIYSFAFFFVYLFALQKYHNIVYLPLFDFGFTVVWALFWFIGSCAWGKAITDIQNYTDPEQIIASLDACSTGCHTRASPTYANIVVSCILGFGNWILWSGDVWFVLKETTWYKTRKEMQAQQQNQTNNPIGASDVNISAHYNPSNRI